MLTSRLNTLSGIALLWAVMAPNAGAQCERTAFEPTMPTAMLQGEARICERRWGLQGDIALEGLEPGYAYTLWWVYFDDVLQCAEPGNCQYADLLPTSAEFYTGYPGCPIDEPSCAGSENPPVGVIGRLGGFVAPADGDVRYRDRLYRLQPDPGAEIWIVVLGHGPANPVGDRSLARQLLTAQDPDLGAPHLGTVGDGPRSEWLAISRYGIDGQ